MPKKLLVCCECSQRVVEAFRNEGCEAWSVDLKPSYGKFPQYHFVGDAFSVLESYSWDFVIAHPPCTYLSKAGSTLLYPKPGILDVNRYAKGLEAARFFMRFYNLNLPYVIENPVPNLIYNLPSPTQCIEPYYFGDPYTKKTYLWLNKVPILFAEDIVIPGRSWVACHTSATLRSETFPGIARAFARQYKHILL